MTKQPKPTPAEELEARSPFRSARVQEILRQIRERQIADLTPSEKALFTRRRKEAYEALHPETKHGVIGATARHAPANLADASFTADTAAKTGQSERVIQRNAERGAKVDEKAEVGS